MGFGLCCCDESPPLPCFNTRADMGFFSDFDVSQLDIDQNWGTTSLWDGVSGLTSVPQSAAAHRASRTYRLFAMLQFGGVFRFDVELGSFLELTGSSGLSQVSQAVTLVTNPGIVQMQKSTGQGVMAGIPVDTDVVLFSNNGINFSGVHVVSGAGLVPGDTISIEIEALNATRYTQRSYYNNTLLITNEFPIPPQTNRCLLSYEIRSIAASSVFAESPIIDSVSVGNPAKPVFWYPRTLGMALNGRWDFPIGVPVSISPTFRFGTFNNFAVVFGALPAGLTLNTATGVISGTPTVAQTTMGVNIVADDNIGGTHSSGSIPIRVV